MEAYFVSYSHSEGFGNIEVYLKIKISHIDHIRNIEDMLNQDNPFNHKNICILNYVVLRTEGERGLSQQVFTD